MEIGSLLRLNEPKLARVNFRRASIKLAEHFLHDQSHPALGIIENNSSLVLVNSCTPKRPPPMTRAANVAIKFQLKSEAEIR
jgi:hypothetical protein